MQRWGADKVNRDFLMLQYKLIRVPLFLSLSILVLLMLIGAMGAFYAMAAGWMCFLWAADILMGKSLVGDDALMMHMLPVSLRKQVAFKIGVLGLWTSVMCSIPVYLMLRNGGTYIDAEILGVDCGTLYDGSLFYRGLPKYKYVIDTCPSAMDVAAGDLVDSGAGVVQIATMAMLVTIIFFAVGCFFAGAVLICQLYLHPLMKRMPTMVVSAIGMLLATAFFLAMAIFTAGMEQATTFTWFGWELLVLVLFGSNAWIFFMKGIRRLEKGFDV